MTKKEIGDLAEQYICTQYKRDGYAIISQNYHTTQGETDIIARKGDNIVVIEVKARKDNSLVPIEYSVTKQKQRRVRLAATTYLQQNNLLNNKIRFDVAFVSFNEMMEFTHTIIKAAF